eukprot:TRINITY_DN21763_c2_g1_i1.p1 TRINITY_DN21763_c2_g1~~TRINITY_DN21763_c2_g1_i1.p1  ORF type:complete len:1007 (-),score=161.73 TRINITY_DN21763_c2_g1_i1:231-3251(-)
MATQPLWIVFWAALAAYGAAGRHVVTLDGQWDFTLDPSNPATKRLAAAKKKVSGGITVPGAWEAQGFGEDTDRMRHQYRGVGIYSKSIALPEELQASGLRTFIVAERIERSAQLFVDDKFVCNHTGYIDSMDCEITEFTKTRGPGSSSLRLRLEVNNIRLAEDGLDGAIDLDTDGTGLAGWGGLAGHVRLEGRSPQGWILHPWVRYTLDDAFASAKVNVSIDLEDGSSPDLQLSASILDNSKSSVATLLGKCHEHSCITENIVVSNPKLWSPVSTAMYTAVIKLSSKTGEHLDTQEVRFGFKKLEYQGPHLKLNGKFLFLSGYGDDAVYPINIAPPVDYDAYAKRLSAARDLNFNWARHHSSILPNEYWDAACDIGIITSAQFPFVYGGEEFVTGCGHKCKGTDLRQWAAVIRRIRNYPCVFDYVVNNEFQKQYDGKDYYDLAKLLDPTRPVSTTDGLSSGFQDPQLSPPEDIRYVGYDASITLLDPGLAKFTGVKFPTILHEFGNFQTFPDLDQLADFKNSNVKPWFVQPMYEKIKGYGLLNESPLWTENSNQLQIFCRKNSVEAARKNPELSGFEWWNFQDWWYASVGIVNLHFKPKYSPHDLKIFKQMVSPVLLLAAEPKDQLPDGPRLLRNYPSRAMLATTIYISNFGDGDIESSTTFSWKVLGIDPLTKEKRVLCSESSPVTKPFPQSPDLQEVGKIQCQLPNITEHPMSLSIEVALADGQTILTENWWRSRIYPLWNEYTASSPAGHRVYTQPTYCNTGIPVTNMICEIPASGTELPQGSVLVVDYYDETILEFAARGATVLLVKATGCSDLGLPPSQPSQYKLPWWIGQTNNNNYGTVVYNDSAAARMFVGMAPDSWADESWFDVISGGSTHTFSNGWTGDAVDILIRALDLHTRQQALMFQFGVASKDGNTQGLIVVTGLNLLVANNDNYLNFPQAGWMMQQLLQYAYTEPKSEKIYTVEVTKCPDCIPPSSFKLCRKKAKESKFGGSDEDEEQVRHI